MKFRLFLFIANIIFVAASPELGTKRLLESRDLTPDNTKYETDDGGWIIIQRRQNGALDFYRDWQEFKYGFGNVQGEYFIGLDNLYALTNFAGPQELLILMDGDEYARYSHFVVGCEAEKYVLKSIGEYEGTAGDSLIYHLGQKFSTRDQDNDASISRHCAVEFTGAWWHNDCHRSNLNGKYGDKSFGKGINWKSLTGHEQSLSYVQMMIRPRRDSCDK